MLGFHQFLYDPGFLDVFHELLAFQDEFIQSAEGMALLVVNSADLQSIELAYLLSDLFQQHISGIAHAAQPVCLVILHHLLYFPQRIL